MSSGAGSGARGNGGTARISWAAALTLAGTGARRIGFVIAAPPRQATREAYPALPLSRPGRGARDRRPRPALAGPPGTIAEESGGLAGADRRDVGLGPVGADDAGGHLVHHVAHRGARIGVHEDERATPAAPVAGPALRDVRHRVGLRQSEADSEAQRHAEHHVDAVAL